MALADKALPQNTTVPRHVNAFMKVVKQDKPWDAASFQVII